MPITSNSLYNSIHRAGSITMNNQSDILLKKLIQINDQKTMIFLLHDNRIFIFEKTKRSEKIDIDVSTPEQNIILNILTTRGFRVLRIMYVLFRLLDNCALLTVIILSVITGKFMAPTRSQLALFSVLGVEVFYDVMLTVNKYWGLQRLSFQIGLVLFFLYYFILSFMKVHLDHSNFHLCMYVVSFRFIAFLIEEMVDIGLDMCIHNVLMKLNEISHDPYARSRGDSIVDVVHKNIHPFTSVDIENPPVVSISNENIQDPLPDGTPNQVINDNQSTWNSIHGGLRNGSSMSIPLMNSGESRLSSHSIIIEKTNKEVLADLMKKNCYLPSGLIYKGSLFAWGTATVKKCQEENYITNKEFDINLISFLFAPAFFPTITICFAIFLIVLVAGLVGFLVYNVVLSLCRWFGADASWNIKSYFEELLDS